jgi:methionyl-tRNA synthetase
LALDCTPQDLGLLGALASDAKTIARCFEMAGTGRAARAFIASGSKVNGYLQAEERWRLFDTVDDERRARVSTILLVVHSALVSLAVMGEPFLPTLMALLRRDLGVTEALSWSSIGQLRTGAKVAYNGPCLSD